MSDYDRIAKVIRYIEEQRDDQPDLATLAAMVDLSPSHFHRLFSRWAGITPKGFLQCLTLDFARQQLVEGQSILNAALDAGLSGPGRLHDLCVHLEAASPGEIKAGGAGWEIIAGIGESPFGHCLIAESPRGVCHLSFTNNWERLVQDWPHADLIRDDQRAEIMARQIFRRDCSATGRSSPIRPLTLFVKGTEFQIKVWRALLQIPEGTLVSYGQLARFMGQPRASRAVGSAIGRNPVGFLIPCHRVIRETGLVGGYAWGSGRKRAIQFWEAKPHLKGL